MKEHLFIGSFISCLFVVSVVLLSSSQAPAQEQENEICEVNTVDREFQYQTSVDVRKDATLVNEAANAVSAMGEMYTTVGAVTLSVAR